MQAILRLALTVFLATAAGVAALAQDSEAARLDADRAYSEGRYEEAARRYEALVDAEPDDWQLAFRLAHSLHLSGDYRRSVEAHRQLARFEEPRPMALYNVACAHSMLGEVEPALDALGEALEAGFGNLELLGSDSDLAAIRGTERFAALHKRYASPSVDEPLTWENLSERMEREEDEGFAGSLLVVRDGRVVLDEGYGLANREAGIPCGADTVYAIGSAPIDFTHVGILLLAQRGDLRLSDPITTFFDDVPEDKRAITVAHLMSGASGLEDFHDLPTDRDPDHSYIDRDEAIRRILSKPLLFEPGRGNEHSHSAWGVLAAICEIVTGATYPEFVQAEIFEPAGMHDTGFFGEPVPDARLAIGYGQDTDGEVNAPPYWGETSWLVMGSGGQISTTGDMDRFQRALRSGRILEPAWAAQYYGPSDGAGMAAAGDMYGFEVRYTQGRDARVILITNGGMGSPSFRQLALDLAGLVNGTGSVRSSSDDVPFDEEPWGSLDELLGRAVDASGLPAIAAAVTRDGEIVDSAAVGLRRVDAPDAVTVGDRFHWGSVGKSVTGTMLGRLLQDGVLSHDTKLSEAFADVDMHPGYRDVTLRQLMAHRGGVPPFTNLAGPLSSASAAAKDPIELRHAFFAGLLEREPQGEPGVTHEYSNAGIALAAHFAELATGKTWEELVREHVFEPAGLASAGHGWPESLGDDQPSGHQDRGRGFVAAGGLPTDHWRVLAPAGNVHGSVEDLARFGLIHLDGLNGRDGYLDPETVWELHDPAPGPGERYAYGWALASWPRDTDFECHWHNGSGGTYYALIKLVPELDLGIAILANGYGGPTEQIIEQLSDALFRTYAEEGR